jgi:hypothetical protein
VAGESDAVLARALKRAASALVEGDPEALGAGDLAGGLAEALRPLVGRLSMAIRDDRVRLAGWPEPTAAVDIAVRGRIAGRQRAVVECSWWDEDDDEQRRRAVRSACMLAAASRAGGLDGYLAAAAPADAWDADGAGVAVFDDGERATLPLLRQAGVERVAEGPARVPGRLRSVAVARVPIDRRGRVWELRAARVAPAGGDLEVG